MQPLRNMTPSNPAQSFIYPSGECSSDAVRLRPIWDALMFASCHAVHIPASSAERTHAVCSCVFDFITSSGLCP